MRNRYKVIILLLVVICCFGVVGCGKKEEKKKDTNASIKLDQPDPSTVKVTLKNAKKGEKKSAKIVVNEGQALYYEYDIKDEKHVNVALCDADAKSEKDFLVQDELVNKDSTYDSSLAPGEYTLYFIAAEDDVTATVTIMSKVEEAPEVHEDE